MKILQANISEVEQDIKFLLSSDYLISKRAFDAKIELRIAVNQINYFKIKISYLVQF